MEVKGYGTETFILRGTAAENFDLNGIYGFDAAAIAPDREPAIIIEMDHTQRMAVSVGGIVPKAWSDTDIEARLSGAHDEPYATVRLWLENW